MKQFFYSIENGRVYSRSQSRNKGDLVYLGWFKNACDAYSFAFWSGLIRKDV